MKYLLLIMFGISLSIYLASIIRVSFLCKFKPMSDKIYVKCGTLVSSGVSVNSPTSETS